jgi:hypothetical protein
VVKEKFVGKYNANHEKLAGIFLAFFAICAVFLVYSFVIDTQVAPAKIFAQPYKGPSGCPKAFGDKVVSIAEGCFSSKNLIADWKERGFRIVATGKSNVIGYYRLDDDAVLVQCYYALDGKRQCMVSNVERNVFVIKNGDQ